MRICKHVIILSVAFLLFVFGTLLCDKQNLQNNLIRLHIVANSDEEADQKAKMLVKEEVTQFLLTHMQNASSKEEARRFLERELTNIQSCAEAALDNAGVTGQVRVQLSKEAFGLRSYDTFSLPSGIYDALRIELGEGKGENWWCVVFPSLCDPVTSSGFASAADRSGFDQTLTGTLTGVYEVRFLLLDWLGRIENFLFG